MRGETERNGGDLYKLYLMVIGSALVTLSSGYGLVAAFNGETVEVYTALIVFVSGYKTAQIGLHNGKESKNILVDFLKRFRAYSRVDILSLIGGSVLMTLGFVALAEAITAVEFSMAATAAVTMGAGYMVEHWAINNTLV